MSPIDIPFNIQISLVVLALASELAKSKYSAEYFDLATAAAAAVAQREIYRFLFAGATAPLFINSVLTRSCSAGKINLQIDFPIIKTDLQ